VLAALNEGMMSPAFSAFALKRLGAQPQPTRFGALYSTNISPDKDNCIGTWTRAEFIAPHGPA
jgi:hypothetical protein